MRILVLSLNDDYESKYSHSPGYRASTMRRMNDEVQLTIEELASQAGTATTTVRMYQSKGLLPPPERRGRVGYYGQGHLARLRLIAQLQEQGFSLASIKQLTDAWESGRGLDDILGLEAQVAD